ncbi:chaperonin 10-like protein [Hyaloraphidium curvatum]|nr:chaperonin 10-like protein [Hyaloraphidium curvatum]
MAAAAPPALAPPGPLRDGKSPRNWAVALTATRQLSKQPHAFPDPPPAGYVGVNVKFCGVCGSDLHVWEHADELKQFGMSFPMVMGHEASGVITAVGPAVDNVEVGQHVALLPWSFHGLLAQHVNHPADKVYPLPPGVSLRDAALVEPLAVGLQAARRAGVKPGDKVAVIGGGPVGLAALLCALALGASRCVVSDLSPARLETAKKVGAAEVVDVSGLDPLAAGLAIADTVRGSKRPCDLSTPLSGMAPIGAGDAAVDCAIDAAGFSSSIATAVYAVKPGGAVSIVGYGSYTPELPSLPASLKSVDLKPSFGYGATGFPDALRMIAEGKVDVGKLVSHLLPMDRAQEGYEMCRGTSAGAVKVVFSTDE